MENNKIIKINENNPINLKFSFQITNDSYGCFDLDNTFTVFTTIYNKINLVYSTKNTILRK
jgi:hypothetical protein